MVLLAQSARPGQEKRPKEQEEREQGQEEWDILRRCERQGRSSGESQVGRREPQAEEGREGREGLAGAGGRRAGGGTAVPKSQEGV